MRNQIIIAVGWVVLFFGVVGMILPVMPTSPFVLVAGGCFCIGNPRLYRWLYYTKLFGPYLQNFKKMDKKQLRHHFRVMGYLWFLLIMLGLQVSSTPFRWVLGSVFFTLLINILLLKFLKLPPKPEPIEKKPGRE